MPIIGLRTYSSTGTTVDFKNWKAIGSITGGSNSFVLSGANPGFQIGDPIIIEIGGEAGAGLRGTRGVGGTWPAQSYPDAATRDADTGKPLNTYAWIETDGSVHQWNGSAWIAQAANQYYTNRAVPRALITTISNISGNTLTLNSNAAVAATNATIYYDNHPYWDTRGATGSGFTPTDNRWIIPAGEFAFSDRMLINEHNNWEIVGQGMNNTLIFSPKGAPSLTLFVANTRGVVIRAVHIKGNARQNGFGLGWGDHNAVTETNITQGAAFPRGIFLNVSDNGLIEDCKITDVFQQSLGTSFCVNTWARRCKIVVTDAIPQYVQWQALWSDGIGGGCIDLEIDSAFMTGGFEGFRHNNITYQKVRARNIGFSMNSSGNFLIDDVIITIDENAQSSEGAWSSNNPIGNINSNIQPPNAAMQQGGTIRNLTVHGQNYINTSNGMRAGPIVVNVDNPNVKIIGTDPSYERCTIYVANYNGDGKQRASGIHSTGANTRIEGMRVRAIDYDGGEIGAIWGDIVNIGAGAPGAAGSTIKDCVVDMIGSNTHAAVVQSGNQTNQEFDGG